MSIATIVQAFQADAAAHTTSGPCVSAELGRVEAALGAPLPHSFREFLAALGGGIFYQRHEIFGAHRVMIHDIELVPDLVSIRRWLDAERPPGYRAGLLPVHRADGVVHVVDLGATGPEREQVAALGGPVVYPDFVRFLERVVVPQG